MTEPNKPDNPIKLAISSSYSFQEEEYMREQSANITWWPVSVIIKTLGVSKSTVYRRVKQKLFPQPVKIGRPSRWPSDEILKVMAAYKAGQAV